MAAIQSIKVDEAFLREFFEAKGPIDKLSEYFVAPERTAAADALSQFSASWLKALTALLIGTRLVESKHMKDFCAKIHNSLNLAEVRPLIFGAAKDTVILGEKAYKEQGERKGRMLLAVVQDLKYELQRENVVAVMSSLGRFFTVISDGNQVFAGNPMPSTFVDEVRKATETLESKLIESPAFIQISKAVQDLIAVFVGELKQAKLAHAMEEKEEKERAARGAGVRITGDGVTFVQGNTADHGSKLVDKSSNWNIRLDVFLLGIAATTVITALLSANFVRTGGAGKDGQTDSGKKWFWPW